MTVVAPTIQPSPGTYALLLSSATDSVIRVGRLGDLRLQPGYYVYVGSALGSGGVRGRLGHHMRPAERPHWHIDYLRKKTTLEAVWCRYAQKSLECQWGKAFLFDGRCGGADGRRYCTVWVQSDSCALA